jgi:hypothetical protein
MEIPGIVTYLAIILSALGEAGFLDGEVSEDLVDVVLGRHEVEVVEEYNYRRLWNVSLQRVVEQGKRQAAVMFVLSSGTDKLLLLTPQDFQLCWELRCCACVLPEGYHMTDFRMIVLTFHTTRQT